jgi:hypothetical protein
MRWSYPLIAISLVVITVFVPRVVRGQDAPVAEPSEVIVFSGDGAIGAKIAVLSAGGGAGGAFAYSNLSSADDSTSLLNWGQVHKELELIDEQIQQIHTIQNEMRRKQADLMRQLGPDGLRHPDVSVAMREEMKEIRDKARDDLEKLLLPHQHERLQQISRRMAMQRRGTASGLTSDALADELGLTDEQKQRLQERGREIEEEVRQEIARLRKKAEDKLLAELTPAQREKLTQLLGNEFDLQKQAAPGAVKTEVRVK